MCCSNNNPNFDSEEAKAYFEQIAAVKRSLNRLIRTNRNLRARSNFVYQTNGEFVRSHWLDFAPQAINFAENGTVFIAGTGKLARLSATGRLELVVDAPNLITDEATREKQIAEQKKRVESMLRSYVQQNERLKDQIEKLEKQIAKDKEAKDADDETNAKKIERSERRLTTLKTTLEQLESVHEATKQRLNESLEYEIDSTRLKRATGISELSPMFSSVCLLKSGMVTTSIEPITILKMPKWLNKVYLDAVDSLISNRMERTLSSLKIARSLSVNMIAKGNR